ncbi:hypothetical protein BDB00DRAFT_937392 [Zychaea mexicana]|uniref:uncharacterized protein n=1 Tax=Zychaea mexicana TaxID=64656 RepID=UPI0022FEDA3E|nr:uncharacterized protein BDB00DRAFT_937392 [Zychaea mexicana]KAI9495849.1 hypothetical protein BDB00DRAFT_937392 [Zychaea mexicana]
MISFTNSKLYYFDTGTRGRAEAIRYPVAVLPFIETQDGQYFGTTVPLLRILGKQLEQTADLASGWVQDYVKIFFQPEQIKYHETEETPRHVVRFERIYGVYTNGPYALGNQITYADFLVYHIIRQEKLLEKLESCPNLDAFIKAFEGRPRIKACLATLPKQEADLVVSY